jgi:hypothetical protein
VDRLSNAVVPKQHVAKMPIGPLSHPIAPATGVGVGNYMKLGNNSMGDPKSPTGRPADAYFKWFPSGKSLPRPSRDLSSHAPDRQMRPVAGMAQFALVATP